MKTSLVAATLAIGMLFLVPGSAAVPSAFTALGSTAVRWDVGCHAEAMGPQGSQMFFPGEGCSAWYNFPTHPNAAYVLVIIEFHPGGTTGQQICGYFTLSGGYRGDTSAPCEYSNPLTPAFASVRAEPQVGQTQITWHPQGEWWHNAFVHNIRIVAVE